VNAGPVGGDDGELSCGFDESDALVVPDEYDGSGAIKVKKSNGKGPEKKSHIPAGESVLISDGEIQNGKIETENADVCIGEDARVTGGITATGGTVTLKQGAEVDGTVKADEVKRGEGTLIKGNVKTGGEEED
jgi:predicted acyltransferase (DUF342 family)